MKLSYSAISTYKVSPLWYYYQYVKKEKPTNPGMKVYGNVGNVVHKSGEDYWNKDKNTFNYNWGKFKINSQLGFNNSKMDFNKFMGMTERLINYMKEIKKYKSVAEAEFKIEFEFEGILIKGFIDLLVITNNYDIEIQDWKTNSTHNYNTHLKQRLMYSWMIWKIKDFIPLCKWVYLKEMDIIEERFTKEKILKFEKELKSVISELKEKGDIIDNYDLGNFNNPFNIYYDLCYNEKLRREKLNISKINLEIRGSYVYIIGDFPYIIEKALDDKTKFDLPDKFWIQKKVKEKTRGKINLQDIGTVHIYNKKFRCFPLGLLDKVKNLISEYCEYYKKDIYLNIIDKRNKSLMNYVSNNIFKENDITLRDYQEKAISLFLARKQGIIHIATGGGKTIIAGEIIKKINGKILWIIDRKELLEQTKETLEKNLGINLGVVYGGRINISDVTISTIQSLNLKLVELKEYLNSVNFVILDEYHKTVAETYQKLFSFLPNTKYRLGLTATPQRDDGKDPILFSHIGEIVYKIDSQDLIKMDYLVKPTIEFFDMGSFSFDDDKYNDDYKKNIVNNNKRNIIIKSLCEVNIHNKILILTKLVDHGKELNKNISGSKHIHGKTKNRTEIMEDFREGKINVLIGTLSIFAEGIDIPDLDVIINASGNKGDVKSIQVLGRVLRTFKEKNEALYYDFLDRGVHTRKHSHKRIKILQKQGYEIKINDDFC